MTQSLSLPAFHAENDPLPAPEAQQGLVDYLRSRRSTKVMLLAEPAPSDEVLGSILTIAARVPDHGKLTPWRFVVLAGEARTAYGEALARLMAVRTPDIDPSLLAFERARFARAPLCVAVISAVKPSPKIVEWEQVLSAGAVCMNLLHAARGYGFGGCWLTEWPAYDAEARRLLGLSETERVAGFIYLGTAQAAPTERVRPAMETLVTHWGQ